MGTLGFFSSFPVSIKKSSSHTKTDPWDRCYDFKNSFAKNGEKIGVLTQNTAKIGL
jgi:hypothetical protein